MKLKLTWSEFEEGFERRDVFPDDVLDVQGDEIPFASADAQGPTFSDEEE